MKNILTILCWRSHNSHTTATTAAKPVKTEKLDETALRVAKMSDQAGKT